MDQRKAEKHRYPRIRHHGAIDGVTGSCHEYQATENLSYLVDCGLFQGAETSGSGGNARQLEIDFPISSVAALIVTHVHIDHVGRIPYLMAAGFKGPIYCSEPSAVLLPLVLEDAVKIGFTRNPALVSRFLTLIKSRLRPIPYGQWVTISSPADAADVQLKLKPAGHILGSAYVELRSRYPGRHRQWHKTIFSGDLGAPYSPLLKAPRPPYSADIMVLESTYGHKNHEDRRTRRERLQQAVNRALENNGTVLIPAFSIGRTQELLYELEQLIHQSASSDLRWKELQVVIDSPLASRFTTAYRQLSEFWDKEARRKLNQHRHPLDFRSLTTINSHRDHLRTVEALAQTHYPAIVVAASGMCAGGRIVNYLKAMIDQPEHDILFVGYQARGTLGWEILNAEPGQRLRIDDQYKLLKAQVQVIGGYSAHADQNNLINFITRMRFPPGEVRLVHGSDHAKKALQQQLKARGLKVTIPR